MYFPLIVGALCLSLICYALLYVHSSLATILKRKRKLVALLLLSNRCLATVNVLWLFLMVPWVGVHCVIVVFPDHTHLLFVLGIDMFCNVLRVDTFTCDSAHFTRARIVKVSGTIKEWY